MYFFATLVIFHEINITIKKAKVNSFLFIYYSPIYTSQPQRRLPPIIPVPLQPHLSPKFIASSKMSRPPRDMNPTQHKQMQLDQAQTLISRNLAQNHEGSVSAASDSVSPMSPT